MAADGEKEGVAGMSESEKARMAVVCLSSAATASFIIAIQYPIIPYLGKSVGATKAQVGVVFAVFPAGQVIGQAACGRLADSIGRKPTLVMFGVAMAILCLVFSMAASPEQLIACGFVAGIAGSTWPVCRTVIVDIMPTEDIPRWMGVANICMSAPYVIGPFFSGRLAEATGNYRLPFVAVAVLAACVSTMIATFMRETRVKPPEAANGNGAAANPASRKGTISCTVHSLAQPILCTCGNSCTQGIQAAYLSSFTPLVAEAYGWEVGQTSSAFALFSSIMLICAAVTTAHNTVKKMGLLTSSVLGALFIMASHYCGSRLALPLDGLYGYPTLSVLMWSWCIGKVFCDPAFLTMTSDAVPKEVLGTFQGTMSAVGSIGGFGMTSMYHIVADRESYRESMLLMAQTFCLALLIFMPSVWLARTHKQATTYDPARLLI